ncbi:hypothetical protein ACHWQZ_G005335 [Mnemiopsis leidyi]
MIVRQITTQDLVLSPPQRPYSNVSGRSVIASTSDRQQEIAEIAPTIATQGNTLNNNEELYAAVHAIDKDLSTVAAITTDNGGGWLKLEFDKTYFIHKVVIYYRFYTNWYNPRLWCVQSVANFKSCVDDANNVDVSVYQGEVQQKSCGTLQLTYGLEQSDQIYTLQCRTEGDTVILSKITGRVILFEVAVTNTGIYIINVFSINFSQNLKDLIVLLSA